MEACASLLRSLFYFPAAFLCLFYRASTCSKIEIARVKCYQVQRLYAYAKLLSAAAAANLDNFVRDFGDAR